MCTHIRYKAGESNTLDKHIRCFGADDIYKATLSGARTRNTDVVNFIQQSYLKEPVLLIYSISNQTNEIYDNKVDLPPINKMK